MYRAMTAMGKPASAIVGSTHVSGPFQPPVGNHLRVTLKKRIRSVARTKLGVATPMIEMPVDK